MSLLTLREGEADRVDEVANSVEPGDVGEVGVDAERVLRVEGQAGLGEVALGEHSRRSGAAGGASARLGVRDEVAGDSANHDLGCETPFVTGAAADQLIDGRRC